MNAFSHPVIRMCRVLDWFRLRVLRLLGAPGKVLVRRRDLRVAAFGCTVILTSLTGSLLVPLWLLALGPVILGTPHVLSDIRYLVMRPGYHRRAVLWLPVGIPLLVAGADYHPMEFGLAAVAAAVILARGSLARKASALAGTAALFALAMAGGDTSRIVFAHAHNFIALALWWTWRPRGRQLTGFVPLLFAGAALSLALGWLAPVPGAWSWFPGGVSMEDHSASLAPGLSAAWAGRLVVLFAFAQAVHYGIWLRLIPEDDRPRDTPRTFAASLKALEQDVGRPLLWGTILTGLAVTAWAVMDLAAARIGYLRMALFHGYLELIAVALLLVEGRKPASLPRPACPR